MNLKPAGLRVPLVITVLGLISVSMLPPAAVAQDGSLAQAYKIISSKRFVDLTHSFSPVTPVWKGFGPATFSYAADPATGLPYTIAKDGFRAFFYSMVGQYGTHIDPPAHFDPSGMTMDSLYDMMSKEGTHELQIRRNGADMTFQLPVFDPFKHPEQIALYKSSARATRAGAKIQSFSVQNIGAPIFPDEVIACATGLNMGDDYRSFTANRALRKLYDTGLFANVGMTTTEVAGGVKVNIMVQANPVVKSITFIGLSLQEEAQVRPRMITEEGKRTSAFDLFQDTDLIRQILGKANSSDRTVSVDVTGDDGTKRHRDIVIPKSGV